MRRIRAASPAAAALLILATGCAALAPAARPGSVSGTLMLWMPGASGVQVLGDWNGWGGLEEAGGRLDPDAGRMAGDGEGLWTLRVDDGLPAGRYRYAFLVDGWRWVSDPSNPETAEYAGRTVSLLVLGD